MRSLLTPFMVLALSSTAAAQDYSAQKPRRQFVTISFDWIRSAALDFASDPVEDLVGQEIVTARDPQHTYETRDGRILIDLVEYRKRNRGFSAAVYPFGLTSGTTLGIRVSVETLPRVRVNFNGEGAPPAYTLSGATAYDVALGVYVVDRPAGFGLGAQAFIVGGVGRIDADEREGTRTFAEGGGGVTFGPFGVQIAVKFARNKFDSPVRHLVMTLPFTVRGTFSF